MTVPSAFMVWFVGLLRYVYRKRADVLLLLGTEWLLLASSVFICVMRCVEALFVTLHHLRQTKTPRC